jgi:8-oxo-dGTP diphosphatase
MTTPTTVTAALICREGKILAAQRPVADNLALLWEFPGGKVEVGETNEECLARELKEELGVEAEIGRYFHNSRYAYPGGEIDLVAYWATIKSGPLDLKFHKAVKWCDRESLTRLAFAPADVPIVELLMRTNIWPVRLERNQCP